MPFDVIAEFRDPIHGFIEVFPHERRIIDTPEFQRLRRIHQLGLTHYVYHGAEHSRFGHALGVMHLAGKAVDGLIGRNLELVRETLQWSNQDSSDERRRLVVLARLSGLLHDIGHSPFSHTGESRLFQEGERHESHGAFIIRNSEIGGVIDSDPECQQLRIDKDDVARLVTGEMDLPAGFVQELISSPWDVDKMDYLLRDSHYCGVQYGTFDIERILNTLAFDLVLTDFMSELLSDEYPSRRYPGTDQIQEYLKWDDNRVLHEANERANAIDKNLAWRIINRQHPKAVYETEDSPDSGIARRVERDLLREAQETFPTLHFWIDRAIDHPDRFRWEEMMVKFAGDPPIWREFRRESQPLQGLKEIGKYRLYADVRGFQDLEDEVRNFCRNSMA